MSTPRRFLFAITDGGGTVPADTSVVRALVRAGHEVRVLADGVLAPDVAATGAEHVAWQTALRSARTWRRRAPSSATGTPRRRSARSPPPATG